MVDVKLAILTSLFTKVEQYSMEAEAAPDIFCNQGIARAVIQVTSAGAVYAPNKFSAGQKFWQGNDQGKGFFTRAFALV